MTSLCNCTRRSVALLRSFSSISTATTAAATPHARSHSTLRCSGIVHSASCSRTQLTRSASTQSIAQSQEKQHSTTPVSQSSSRSTTRRTTAEESSQSQQQQQQQQQQIQQQQHKSKRSNPAAVSSMTASQAQTVATPPPTSNASSTMQQQTSQSTQSLLQQETEPRVSIPDSVVDSFACRPTTGVTLKQMFQFGQQVSPHTLLASSQFLHRELPIRLAKRIKDLEDLPFGLSQSVEIQAILAHFRRSFADAVACAFPSSTAAEQAFTRVCRQILHRHSLTVVQMQHSNENSFIQRIHRIIYAQQYKQAFLLQEFLDRFNVSRIGLRLLLAQHVALHRSLELGPKPGFVGVIAAACNPAAIVAAAVDDCRLEFEAHPVYGVAPRVRIQDKAKQTFRYVPGHLRYILFELLKNSMRATVEHTRTHHRLPQSQWLNPECYAPIDIVIVDGEGDLIIKVSDRGGGIRRADMSKLYTYTFANQAGGGRKVRPSTPLPPQLLQQQQQQENQSQQQQQDADVSSSSVASALASGVQRVAAKVLDAVAPALATSTSHDDIPNAISTAATLSATESDWLQGECSVANRGALFGEAFGCPLARIYARYFGGDLELYSMHSYGTDAYVRLSLMNESSETQLD